MGLTKVVVPDMISGNIPFNRIDGTPLNALDYGADPTGAEDSTQAIKDAIAAGLAENNTVYIPAGTYKITSVITLSSSATPYLTGVNIVGAGARQTVLSCEGTAFVQSNQDQVNDNIRLSDLSIVNASSSATIGLDIGTVRNSTFTNVIVKNFNVGFAPRVNRGVANWWNRFYNCEAWGNNVAGGAGWVLGNDGTPTPITGLTTIPDLDYNDFYGCKSYDCTVGVQIKNAIGCVISGHQVTSCVTALQIAAGNNNYIELNGEAVTNMGFAQGPTLANTFLLYNDGRLATDFDDGGLNQVGNQILEQTTLPNVQRNLDCFVNDRVTYSFTAASKNIFQIAFTAPDFSCTITTASSGYTSTISGFASVQVWDITRTNGGAITVTSVRSSGTASVITATGGTNQVVFSVAGNASHVTTGQTVVNVQGFGTTQTYPYAQALGYLRI